MGMELSFHLIVLASCLVLITCTIFSYMKHQSKPLICKSTTLRSYPIVGTLPHFIKNAGRLLDWATELTAASPTHTAVVAPIVFTANPANIEHMLKTRFDNYPKGERYTTVLHDFLGDGIFNTDGERWKEQRRTASFEFKTRSLRAFVVDIIRSKAVGSLIPMLEKASIHGGVVDLQDVFERLAFDGICRLVFNEDPLCLSGSSSKGSSFYRAFKQATSLSIERIKQPLSLVWKIQKWLDIGLEKKLRESIQIVHSHVGNFLRAKKVAMGRNGAGDDDGSDDLVSRFMREGNQQEEYLRDFLVNLVLAGGDTTPSTLTWLFWVLSRRPDIVDNVMAEIKSIRTRYDNYDTVFTLEELRDMQYLHAVISETLRLYPAVTLDSRTCRESDVMPDGTFVRKGWTVMYNPYAMGRMETIWGEDCMEVKPERWLEEGVFIPKNPFQYPVFHAGPRMCLGKDMAYLQIKAVAACVLERFEMELAEERGEPLLGLSLTMKGGLPMRFIKARKLAGTMSE